MIVTRSAYFSVSLGVPPQARIILAGGTERPLVGSKTEAYADLVQCQMKGLVGKEEAKVINHLIGEALLPDNRVEAANLCPAQP